MRYQFHITESIFIRFENIAINAEVGMTPFLSRLYLFLIQIITNSSPHEIIGACDFQQCGILTSADSDEPV